MDSSVKPNAISGVHASVLKSRRYSSSVLVVSRSGTTNNQLRVTLKTCGYSKLIAANSHAMAIDRMRGRSFGLVLFDAKGTDMAGDEFVRQALDLGPEQILVAVSSDPKIDDVFNLLRCGARGFIAMPFSPESVEKVIDAAFEGPPFSQAVLQAPDRNAALSGVVLNNLYRVSVLLRQSREFESAKKEVERYKYSLSESVELARLFCEGGDDNVLREKICDDCLTRAEMASSRLGRTRIRLRKERSEHIQEEQDEDEE